MRSNFLLSFIRALKLPLKLLAGFLRKNKYQEIIKKAYEPKFRKNEKRIKSLSFKFHDNVCDVKLETDTAVFQLAFGAGMWQTGETTKHGPSLVAGAKGSFVGLPPLKVAATYTWKDENTLVLKLRYIESPHTEKMVCNFDGYNISIDIENSFDYGNKKTTLKGKLK